MVATPPRAGSRGVYSRHNLTSLSEVAICEFSTTSGHGDRRITIFCHPTTEGTLSVEWKNPVTGEWLELASQACDNDVCTVVDLDYAVPYGRVLFQPDTTAAGGDSIGFDGA